MELESALETLAQRIRSERKSQGLSQTELANIAGVSLNFLSQLESGKSTAQLDKVLLVIHSLGLELHIQYGKQGISK
jgi:y4mF family transcriptional regulator